MRYARIQNGVVVEIIALTEHANAEDIYPPAILQQLIECDGEVAEGWIASEGTLSPPAGQDPSAVLDDLKSHLRSNVDTAAEAERLKYITAGAGQAMTYQQEADEAARYLSASNPKPADYPMLAAEVGITAEDFAGVAAVVNAAYRNWQQLGASIEAVRLGTKAAIDAATNVDDAHAIIVAVNWPNPS